MTNEQMERKMEFIVETLARVAVNDEKHEMRLSRLERTMKLVVRAGLRERSARTQGDEGLKKAMTELAEAQKRTQESIAHTDKNLATLIDTVHQRSSN